MSGWKVFRRLTLRTHGGKVYLDRWGIGLKRFGTVYLHRMEAPDPGLDLHDHPWTFVTLPLWGGYYEERADIRTGAQLTRHSHSEERRPLRPRVMRLDEAHTILHLRRKTAWSLVVTGPVRRNWGFYLKSGWVDHDAYEDTPEGRSRLMEWTSNYKGDGWSEFDSAITDDNALRPTSQVWPESAGE